MTQFLEQEFDPQKIEDFDVIDVDACRFKDLKKELEEIQADEDVTDSDVKVVFAVVTEEDFLRGNCQDEFDRLQATLGDLNCGDLKEFEDFITIGVDSSSECKALEMKEAVLEENAQLKDQNRTQQLVWLCRQVHHFTAVRPPCFS